MLDELLMTSNTTFHQKIGFLQPDKMKFSFSLQNISNVFIYITYIRTELSSYYAPDYTIIPI